MLLLLPLITYAETEDDEAPWTFNFYFENDLFTETDQSYTNGLRFSLVSPNLNSFQNDERLPIWVRELNQHLAFMDPTIGGHRLP